MHEKSKERWGDPYKDYTEQPECFSKFKPLMEPFKTWNHFDSTPFLLYILNQQTDEQ